MIIIIIKKLKEGYEILQKLFDHMHKPLLFNRIIKSGNAAIAEQPITINGNLKPPICVIQESTYLTIMICILKHFLTFLPCLSFTPNLFKRKKKILARDEKKMHSLEPLTTPTLT